MKSEKKSSRFEIQLIMKFHFGHKGEARPLPLFHPRSEEVKYIITIARRIRYDCSEYLASI